jgi:hypothetical protein
LRRQAGEGRAAIPRCASPRREDHPPRSSRGVGRQSDEAPQAF